MLVIYLEVTKHSIKKDGLNDKTNVFLFVLFLSIETRGLTKNNNGKII